MLTLTLLSIACCCGVPAYFAKPIWDQYPASPRDPLPTEVRDLRLLDNRDGKRAAEQLKQEVQARNLLGGEPFAAVYRDGAGKRVVIYGSTGFRLSPESDVEKEFARIQEEYRITTIQPIRDGVARGEYRSCGLGEADGDAVVVCTWADHGSLATALFTRLSIPDSSDLLSTLRTEVIQRKPIA
ncbi:hypothetical protein I0C86_25995 [Plantactinospora sp. S1510]|uniref:Uncharacterized protein n=1 Tax=Plantactinospora alkalitolerans TaxID=2789879 RepID=A0ABS0H1Z4_9ACTN|nr:hypothetical protein [Plantactinospora alkalitolerans]MBF9132374.1 hypothetical protein [Plantactinospora alkalitolerans]